MKVNRELAVSKGHTLKDLWETPDPLYIKLNDEFGFTLDPCCEHHTAKCVNHFTPEENGLTKDWAGYTVYVNPPYSRENIDVWVYKCLQESLKPNTVVVALLPVSTSSRWFHDFIWGKAEIRFIKGRVRFKGAPFTAPFSSMIVIWKSNKAHV